MKDCVQCVHIKWRLQPGKPPVPVMTCPIHRKDIPLQDSADIAENCNEYQQSK